jgi:hypothetical protein
VYTVFSTVPSVASFCTPCSQDSNLCSTHTLLPPSYHLHTDLLVSFVCIPECYSYLIPQPWQTYQKCVSSFVSKLFRNGDRSGCSPCLGVVGDQSYLLYLCFVTQEVVSYQVGRTVYDAGCSQA